MDHAGPTFELDIPVYEDLLDRDPRWALNEGGRHFEEASAVFRALHKIADRLKALEIPYVVVGGMALFQHGLRRFTEDVDILVTKDDLRRIHEKLDGLGYLPPFARSKHLRDTELGVKIEFLTTGDFPGDGRKKPVAFPDPRAVGFESDGVRYIHLSGLVELKLASGMTNPGRLKDLSDVLELIKAIDLKADLAEQLNPYVRPKFAELWNQARRRFVADRRGDRATPGLLDAMRRDGVSFDEPGFLVTTDPQVAEKYGMVEESEYWEADEAGGSDDSTTSD